MYSESRRYIDAPLNAAWLVQEILQQGQVPFSVKAPTGFNGYRSWNEKTELEVKERLRASPAKNWLVDGGSGHHPDNKMLKMFKLLPFQLETIFWASERPGSLIQVPAGGGKTVISSCWLALDPKPGPKLVVTKSPVVTQFHRSLEWFLGGKDGAPFSAFAQGPPSAGPTVKTGRKIYVSSGKQKGWQDEVVTVGVMKRLNEYFDRCSDEGTPPIVICGWGSLTTLIPDLEKIKWSSVVFDEVHVGKATQRYEWFSKEEWGVKENLTSSAWRLSLAADRVLAMSATLIPNTRIDLWAPLTLIDPAKESFEPGGWGFTCGRWGRRYTAGKAGQYGGMDYSGVSNTEELLKRLSFVRHVVPKAVTDAELPPMRIQTRFVPVSEQDKTTGFSRDMKKLAKEAHRGVQGAHTALAELQLQEAAARKKTATLELVRGYVEGKGKNQQKGKVVIFTGRHRDCVETAEKLRAHLKGVDVFQGIKRTAKGTKDSSFELITGDERQKIQDQYMNHPGPCVLVATGQAWGTGLDLQDTDLLAVVMLPYDPGNFEQWMRRVKRLGMTRPVTVVMLVAEGTIDLRRVVILADKIPDIEELAEDKGIGQVRDSLMGRDDVDALLDGIVSKVARVETEWEEEWLMEG